MRSSAAVRRELKHKPEAECKETSSAPFGGTFPIGEGFWLSSYSCSLFPVPYSLFPVPRSLFPNS